MVTATVAALVAVLVLGFVEGLARFYPARQTWSRLRRRRGRLAMRKLRERFEEMSQNKTPRRLAIVLLVLMVAWVASASLLDKRWHEVVFDVLPYVFVGVALLRTPAMMRNVAERMKDYEGRAGDDPESDVEEDDGGPEVATAL